MKSYRVFVAVNATSVIGLERKINIASRMKEDEGFRYLDMKLTENQYSHTAVLIFEGEVK